jgi:mRNA interferase RelE/StbE
VATYRIEVTSKTVKEIARLEQDIGMKILQSVENLALNPRPGNSRKLFGSESSYRIRVRDYRVIYRVDDHMKQVTVYRVAHRREAYR